MDAGIVSAGPWIEGPAVLASSGIGVREERPEDWTFLEALYASTRTEELMQVPWPAEMKAAFLADQFRLQSLHYSRHYPGLARHLITERGSPAGRIYLHCIGADWRIVDISLLPSVRGKGIGTAFLQTVGKHAHTAGGYVSIHVELHNPARRLYERLGFKAIEDRSPYLLMHWHGASASEQA